MVVNSRVGTAGHSRLYLYLLVYLANLFVFSEEKPVVMYHITYFLTINYLLVLSRYTSSNSRTNSAKQMSQTNDPDMLVQKSYVI